MLMSTANILDHIPSYICELFAFTITDFNHFPLLYNQIIRVSNNGCMISTYSKTQ